jgi:hypothetical protein
MEILELKSFARSIKKLLNDEEKNELNDFLSNNSEAGDVV